jgi:hypothetical protein
VPRYPPAADAPLAQARDDFQAKRSEAAISVGAVDPGAFGDERVGERPSAKKGRSHMAAILQTTQRRESGDSPARPVSLTSHPFRALVNTPMR